MADSIQVLHVDDEPGFTDMVAHRLESENEEIRVVTKTDPHDGLATLENTDIDCVISDYQMPDSTGLDFLSAVREEYPDLPFILFTGQGSEEIASEAISKGVTEYMQKNGVNDQCPELANRIENAVTQHRTEKEIDETREYYQTLVEESTDVILIVDPDGTVQYATPSSEQVLGRTPEELDGTNGFEPIHPHDQGHVTEQYADLVDDPDERQSVEFRYQRPDGEYIWLEARGRNLLDHPLVDGLVVYTRDITERKELELELKNEQRFIQTVIDSLDDIFYVLDEDGGLELWNDQLRETTGYTDDEIAGMNPEEFFIANQQEHVPGVETTVEGFDEQQIELDIVTTNGERIPHEFRGVTVVDEETDEVYRGGVARDITEQKHRRRELREEKAFTETVLESVIDFYWVIDLDGYVTGWSDTDGSVTGYTEEEAIGMHSSAFHPEEHVPRIQNTITEIKETGSATGEAALLTKDGERIPYYFTGTALTDNDGNIEALCGSGQDISERKQREAELEEYQAFTQSIMDALDDILYVTDPDGNFIRWNQKLPEASGYSDAEIEAMDPSEFFKGDDEKRVAAYLERVMEEGEATIEADIVTKDGQAIPYESRAVRLTDTEGELIGVCGISRDISDRKARERKLEEAKDRFQTIVEQNLMGIYLIRDDEITYVNPHFADIYGYTPEELSSRSPLDLVAEADRERVEQNIEQRLGGEADSIHYTFTGKRKDGETIDVEVHGTRVALDGEPAILGVARDITERRQRKRELERYQTMVETVKDGVYALDQDFQFIAVNEAMTELSGYPRDEFIGAHISNWLDDDIVQYAQEQRERLRQGEIDVASFEAELPKKEGGSYIAEIRFTTLPSEDGFRGTTGVVRDITERKQQEHELEETTSLLELALESANAGAWEWDRKTDELDWHTSGHEMFGLDADIEPETMDDLCEIIHPDDRPALQHAISQVEDEADEISAEFRLEPPESESTPWIRMHAIAEQKPDELGTDSDADSNNSPRIVGIALDITQVKRYEQRLHELHDATDALLNASSREEIAEQVVEAVETVLDHPTNIVRLRSVDGQYLEPVARSESAYDMMGERPDYSLGEGTVGQVFVDEEPRIYDDVQTLDDGYDRGDARAGLYVPIEGYGVISINSTAPGVFEQSDVELASILATHTATVLDRLQQEQELARQNDRLERFASVMSHDLRNPLNVASGRLELARQDVESSHHEAIERAHQRMEQIIDDVLTLTRSDGIVEEREAIELATTADSCWRNVDTPDGTLQVEGSNTFFGDRSRVRHVFENLFRNAVEHSSGTVTVQVGALTDGFYVEDDGPGIPPRSRDRIFEYGYSTNADGTGLGLAIVEQIVADHGWEITVTEGRNGGTRFEVTGFEGQRAD